MPRDLRRPGRAPTACARAVPRRRGALAWLGAAALLLGGCDGDALGFLATDTPTPSATSTPSPTPTPTVTPSPTATPTPTPSPTPTPTPSPTPTRTPRPPTSTPDPNVTPTPHPLSIAYLRGRDFPGSELVIDRELEPGAGYRRYLSHYDSDGLRIDALLTIPEGTPPEGGWPGIIFNHGYIPPERYRTTERYEAYVDHLARAGYALLKPDFRGHGASEGEAKDGYGTSGYTIDALNAMSSLQRREDVNAKRIGMFGHSMGGHITLRSMVSRPDIRVGVIWAGVVAPYADLLERWQRLRLERGYPPERPRPPGGYWRPDLLMEQGFPVENPVFWDAISAATYLDDLSGPLQLHHATGDVTVPVEFSDELAAALEARGRPAAYFRYEGGDHNLTGSFGPAMRETIAFFDAHLKGETLHGGQEDGG